MRVVIVGGGLGGMTAALSLRNHPDLDKSAAPRHDVQICESRERPTNSGAFIYLRPAAHRYISTIAAGKHIDTLLSNAARQQTFTVVDKGLLSTFDMGDDFIYTVVYQEIWDALYNTCLEVGIPINFGKPVIGVEEHNNEAVVNFKDGTSISADLVIGADGRRSVVRTSMFEALDKPHPRRDFPVVYTGIYDIMAAIPASEIPSSFEKVIGASTTVLLKGKQGAIFSNWIDSDHKWIGIVLQKKVSVEQVAEWKQRRVEDKVDALHHFRATLSDINGPYDELYQWCIENPEQKITLHTLSTLETPPTWHSSRIVIIGDAAHAIPPYTAYGFTSTCLDSMAMSPILTALPQSPTADHLHAALESWEQSRRPAMMKVVNATLKEGKLRHKEGFFYQWFRALSTWAFSKMFSFWATFYRIWSGKGAIYSSPFETD